jgi:kynureninase
MSPDPVETSEFSADADWAARRDAADPLAPLRAQFLFPPAADGADMLYFAGHSLGLQPRDARRCVEQELDDWARYGVEGHFKPERPWLSYHELLTEPTARLVGARPSEVVVMNTLTVNLHLLLVSFYRPTAKRFRIVVEAGAFPSDQYAVASQVRWHGLDPAEAIVELRPRPGASALTTDDVLDVLARYGDSIALVLPGQCNYLTGQALDVPRLVEATHRHGALFGLDLAHGAGNLLLQLHDWDVDFAVWCNYKYLNAGPGGLGGAFVHDRHAVTDRPRLAGWWGHDKATRFRMPGQFKPISGAEGWQLSNPPILQLAVLRASMALFDSAGLPALRRKSEALTGYLAWLLERIPGVELLTPRDPAQRGAMLTIRVPDAAGLVETLHAAGVMLDARPPDIVRIAPAPLYTRFADVQRLGVLLRDALSPVPGDLEHAVG